MGEPDFTWEVQLPERGARALGQRPACAKLTISSPDHGQESLSIPVAVAKKLDGARDAGELCPTSRAELLYRLQEVSRACGRLRIEALVNKRDYSTLELTQKLRQDGYGERVATELATHAAEVGILDDVRFAESFIRSKVLSGWGSVKISRELERRGISVSDVEGWPEEFFSADEERERALELAGRRRLTGKNDYEKIVRHLCSRGFRLGLATEVAKEVLGRE